MQINIIDNAVKTMISPLSGRNNFTSALLIASMLAWVVLFALGLAGYSGSKAAYVLFSIVTGVMLLTGLRQMTSYGYLFFTVFLWLGFWLKMTLHVILNYPFVEPVGSFFGGAGAWDDVLYAATVASMGVVLGKILFDLIKSRSASMRRDTNPVVPPWYAKSCKWLWIGLMVTSATVLLTNMTYGIHLIGLAPRSELAWPLNAVVAWLLNIGLATGIAVFLWWDILLKKNITLTIYAVIVEAFFSSVSILSRAAYVFHAIPQLWAVSRFKHALTGWSRVKTGLLAVIFVLFLVVSISAVTTFRNYLYQSGAYSSTAYQMTESRLEVVSGMINVLPHEIENSLPAEKALVVARFRELLAEKSKLEAAKAEEKRKWTEAMKSSSAQSRVLLNEFGYQITGGFPTLILHLSVDRWIGLEGLMAVQSYPDKNMGLLWRGLSEKTEAGKPDIYQTISNSIYLKSDGAKFRFATLPGAAAFLYYSNSLLVVMLGMIFFSFAVLVIEFFINALTGNPILCSLYGVVIASSFTQFGVSPRQSLPYFFMLACSILLVWMIQTKFFTLILCKMKLFTPAPPRDH